MNTPKRDEHVAVIYVHGMGEQRRFEETARLVDAIDIYLNDEDRDKNEYLHEIEPGIEKSRIGKEDDLVKFISAKFKDQSGDERKFRFYEAYWASLASKGRKPLDVIRWLYGVVRSPWRTSISPWRARQRLRRAHLYKYSEETGADEKLTAMLAMCYRRFEGPAALEKYRKGSFSEFIDYIRNGAAKETDSDDLKAYKAARRPDPQFIEPMVELAHVWRGAYLRAEILKAFALVTIALGLTLAILASLYVLAQSIGFATEFKAAGEWSGFISLLSEKLLELGPAGLLLVLSGAFGPSRFLSRFLGDVQFWTTYEETDGKHKIRSEIMQSVTNRIKHVLKDKGEGPLCTRCVIVSHSLGSSVAHEALLDIAHVNRASMQHGDVFQGDVEIEKISHFITLASPIDKIHYLFESRPHSYHRYNRFVDDLRGDITSAPFSKNEKPHTHWVNYWDQGDIVSDALYTPLGAPKEKGDITDRFIELRPDNVRTANLPFFSPAKAHEAYFRRRAILQDLYEMIFKDEYNFSSARIEDRKGRRYDEERISDIDARRPILSFSKTASLALPWLALIAIIGQIANSTWLMLLPLAAALVLGAILFALASANQNAKKDLIRKLK